MQLTLAYHPVTSIRLGAALILDGTVLTVNAEQLRAIVLEDPLIEAVDIEVAAPNDSLRAGPVFDIVEPRAKEAGGSPDWPGILGAPQTAGSGTTHVLTGAAVTMLREDSSGDSRGDTGYVLEMSGAPAAGSHYGTLQHLIVVPHTRPGISAAARQRGYRLAQLKIAVRLAQTAFSIAPERTEVFDNDDAETRAGLPRLVY
ncbi:MAG TPA: glycine/sarcosine/betaine reductase component B subunit, partial [Candidatus Binatia bacterium]|nr:glycine/sarcosine/betaine reductase component B subunit [Candidatus Binatia bacterium]